MIGIAASAIGPFPLAALQDLTGDFTLGLIVVALLPSRGVITIAFARPEPRSAPAPASTSEQARAT